VPEKTVSAPAPAARVRRPQLRALARRAAAVPLWLRVFGAGLLVAVALVAAKGAHDAAQTTVNGVVTGTYFALGAVGLALVFGVLRLVNFAHGDMLTFAAYITLLFSTTLGLPIVAAMVVGTLATAALAAVSEFVLWRPMRGRGAGGFQLLLITIGLAFVIRNTIQLFAGSTPRTLNVNVTSALNLFGHVRIGRTQLIAVVVGLVALLLVGLLLRVTRTGKQMRALSDNVSLAEVSGIDTRRVILFTWALAGGLAGLAGVVSAAAIGVMTPNFGWVLLLSLFAAAVLGGMKSAYGALAGGLVLGLVEEWSTMFVDSRWKFAIGFGVLLVALLVRPTGLLGRPEVT
jgi:branched-chain amino acid transport system permease protein